MERSQCEETPGILGAVPPGFLDGALNRADILSVPQPRAFEGRV